ncbi:hypothetical protein [Paenisporosarcina antarctica]|nr:hypothetical protein [Paenisporosarcina antarctica]
MAYIKQLTLHNTAAQRKSNQYSQSGYFCGRNWASGNKVIAKGNKSI